MTREEAIELGFKPMAHCFITGTMVYELTRNNYLSLSSVGSPNEMLSICSRDYENPNVVTDVVVLHNWDYDGPLPKQKVKAIITALDHENSHEGWWVERDREILRDLLDEDNSPTL